MTLSYKPKFEQAGGFMFPNQIGVFYHETWGNETKLGLDVLKIKPLQESFR